MTNDTQAEQTPESGTQGAAVPTANQQVSQPAGSAEADQSSGGAESQAPAASGLPDSASERTTEQFDKLKTQLREERAQREKVEGTFRDYYSSTQQSANKQTEATQAIVDPDTGLIDEKALNALQGDTQKALKEAQEALQASKQSAQAAEEREAFATHPELDRNDDSFDNELHVKTRRILTDAMLNPNDYGGRQLSFKQAADIAKGLGGAKEAKAEGAKEAIESLTDTEQAALAAQGSSGRRTNTQETTAELSYKTRHGDDQALADRIKALNNSS